MLVGTNPLNIELLWDQMYTSSNFYGRRGVFVMALSGVDNALWDILGKHADQPVYRLLGGTTKERIPVYNTGVPETIQQGLDLGMRHFKVVIWDGLFEGEAGKRRTEKALNRSKRIRDSCFSCFADLWVGLMAPLDYGLRSENLR